MTLQEKHLAEQSFFDAIKPLEERHAEITKDYMKRFAEWLTYNYITGESDFYFSVKETRENEPDELKKYRIDKLIEIFLNNEK